MSRDTFEFVAQLAREFPNASNYTVVDVARKLMRYGRQYSTAAVNWCNGDIEEEQYEKITDRLESKLRKSVVNLFDPQNAATTPAARLDAVPKDFFILGGDPRGATVKLRLPSGRSNSFGGEGWCVPKS